MLNKERKKEAQLTFGPGGKFAGGNTNDQSRGTSHDASAQSKATPMYANIFDGYVISVSLLSASTLSKSVECADYRNVRSFLTLTLTFVFIMRSEMMQRFKNGIHNFGNFALPVAANWPRFLARNVVSLPG